MFLLAFLAFVACSDPSGPVAGGPEPAAVVQPEGPKTAVETVSPGPVAPGKPAYVRASSLNLRAKPVPTGEKLGTLTVNSPLDVTELTDGWAQVAVRNGKTGWVSAEFLASAPLTAEEARSNAASAATPADALSWWQRAAALDPSVEVLEGLAAAYEAAGKSDQAERVRAQLRWPARMLFVHQDSHDDSASDKPRARAIWKVGYELGRHGPISRDRWEAYGLLADEEWWLLPAEGPAIRTKVVGFGIDTFNECAGDDWLAVELEMPAGFEPVLAHRGAPPASWAEPGPKPSLSRADAEAQLRALAAKHGKPDILTLVADGDAWVASAHWETGEYGELGSPLLRGLKTRIGSGAAPEVELLDLHSYVDPLRAIRDISGDGVPDHVYAEYCESWVDDAKGETLARTAYACCGC
ncbi:MAG: SH3 domain-containing protein [Myxococcota bacterium]